MMHEYVYIWDRKLDKCIATWYVRPKGDDGIGEPLTSHGPIEEEIFDEHVKKLISKYPEPRYLVDGGESAEKNGERAAGDFIKQIKLEEKEQLQEREKKI
jgi:hypothetical protein